LQIAKYVQCFALLTTDAWHGWVGEVSPVEERHDVEWGANYIVVFAKTECFGNGDIGTPQALDNLILALDLVCCLREQLSGGLLPQDKLLAVGGRQLVGWVGLAESKLGRSVLVLVSAGL
jgi:hypothetical protein